MNTLPQVGDIFRWKNNPQYLYFAFGIDVHPTYHGYCRLTYWGFHSQSAHEYVGPYENDIYILVSRANTLSLDP